MPSPFPGLDPYLESPRYWSDLHESFITYAREALQPQLPPHYRALIGERLTVQKTERVMIPDVTVVHRPTAARMTVTESGGGGTALALAIEADEPIIFTNLYEELREAYIEIIDRTGQQVITSIEVLSPVNKTGEGRKQYLNKQNEMRRGGVNLVEIDLLTEGEYTVVAPQLNTQAYHALVSVWRAAKPHRSEGYLVHLHNRLPRIRIPLRTDDADVVLDVQAVFTRCYDAARYDLDLDYSQPPPVELTPAERMWVEGYLREQGLR